MALFIGVGVTAVAGNTANAAPAATPESIYVVTFNGESILDGMSRMSAANVSYRDNAQVLVSAWKAQLAAGVSLNVPGLNSLSPAQQTTALDAAQSSLASIPANQTPPDSKQAVAVQVAAAASGGGDPYGFPDRGAKAGPNTYWNMTLTASNQKCGTSGCNPPADTWTSRVRIDPGAVTTKFSTTSTYSPNAGNFTPHLQLWTLEGGAVNKEEDTPALSTGGRVDYLSSIGSLRGKSYRSAVTLWIYVKPASAYIYDGGKTTPASCNTSNNICKY